MGRGFIDRSESGRHGRLQHSVLLSEGQPETWFMLESSYVPPCTESPVQELERDTSVLVKPSVLQEDTGSFRNIIKYG